MSWQGAVPFDPWAVSNDDDTNDMQDSELDLTDCFDDASAPATAYIQSGTGWITQAKAHMFILGCKKSVNEVYAQTYRALDAPNRVEPYLGMDRSLGPCRVEDVRSQPVDRDDGYETMDRSGQGPKYTEVVRCLLQYEDRINRNDMVYLIVDNRNPADVPHWPASRCKLVGPHKEKTDVLWVTANHQNGLRDVPYYWAGVFVLEVARFL